MRLRVHHEIDSQFAPPAAGLVRKLRITPRTYDGQYVGSWRIDVDHDCRLDRIFDAYGNVVHNFSVVGPLAELKITAIGEVEVDDTSGVLQASSRERLPPSLFLRSTALTGQDPAIHDFAAGIRAAAASPLDRCHALMHALSARIDLQPIEPGDLVGPSVARAAGVLEAGEATPVSVAHLFCSVARALGVPARFVSGYLLRGDRRDAGDAAHVWAEAHVDGLGWVGFDVPNDRCPTDAYVRVSASLDQNGAAFVRGAEQGGGSETLKSASRVIVTQVDF